MINLQETTKHNDKKRDSYIGCFLLAACFVIVLWLAYLFLLQCLAFDWVKQFLPRGLFNSQGDVELGTFGDFFGALNTLFAGLAFAGLIVTIRQQSKDLQSTKDEMQNQTSQFREQNLQSKQAQIKEDIYNRISLIKQIERDIEIQSWKNGEKSILRGAHAIEELGNNILAITSKIFPDKEDTRNAINITSITIDCLSYACSFQYLDAWLNSICHLLDDIDKSFNIVEDEGERETLKNRYWRMVLKASNMSLIPILYANHDTYLQYTIVEHLRRIKVIEERTLSQGIIDSKKRSLLYSILCNLPGENADAIVYDIANQWRMYKGWLPFCPMMKAQSVSSPCSYDCSIAELRNDPLIRQQIRDEFADRSIYETEGSANSQTADYVVFCVSK